MTDYNSITDGQRLAVTKLFSRFAKDRNARLWILSQIFGRDIQTTADLTASEWRVIRDEAYPRWPSNNWEISEEFISEGRKHYNRYEEKVIGQKRLF